MGFSTPDGKLPGEDKAIASNHKAVDSLRTQRVATANAGTKPPATVPGAIAAAHVENERDVVESGKETYGEDRWAQNATQKPWSSGFDQMLGAKRTT